MQPRELDALLHAPEPAWYARVLAAVDDLVHATERDAWSEPVAIPRVRPRGIRVAVIVAAAAVVLTAGASVTAAQLGIPPFQTIESGTERTTTAISVDYTQRDGRSVRCLAFMEFVGLDQDRDARVESYIRDHDWAGFGQAIYDRAVAKSGSPATADISPDAALFREARRVFPGLARTPMVDNPQGLSFHGSSMSCTPQGK